MKENSQIINKEQSRIDLSKRAEKELELYY